MLIYGKISPREYEDKNHLDSFLLKYPESRKCYENGFHVEDTNTKPIILSNDWGKHWYRCYVCGHLIYTNKK